MAWDKMSFFFHSQHLDSGCLFGVAIVSVIAEREVPISIRESGEVSGPEPGVWDGDRKFREYTGLSDLLEYDTRLDY